MLTPPPVAFRREKPGKGLQIKNSQRYLPLAPRPSVAFPSNFAKPHHLSRTAQKHDAPINLLNNLKWVTTHFRESLPAPNIKRCDG